MALSVVALGRHSLSTHFYFISPLFYPCFFDVFLRKPFLLLVYVQYYGHVVFITFKILSRQLRVGNAFNAN
jgi:hypothetical protein